MEQIRISTGEFVYRGRLSNGLTVFVLTKPQYQKKYAVLSTNYGSIDYKFEVPNEETIKVPPGIAHFLEHKLFEDEEGNAFHRFAQWGASVNAFTSYTQTSYLFSTIEHWRESLGQLIRFVNHPYLTEENVEKEKGIIEQELRMYEDHPDHRLHFNLLNSLYHHNPVRLDIGGTVESVYQISVEQLLKCYYTFYQPANMALAVVGDIDPGETLQLIKEHYLASGQNGVFDVERLHPEEPREIVRPWYEQKLSISRPRYLLGFKHDPKWRGEELLRQKIVMSLVWRLIVGRSSQIFTDLYQADLVTDSFSAGFNTGTEFAYSLIGSATDNPEGLHEELKRIIEALKDKSVCSFEVERLKRQMYGAHVGSYDSLEYTANRFISNHFDQIPLDRFLAILQSLTPEDVQAAIGEALDFSRSSVSILRPVNNDV